MLHCHRLSLTNNDAASKSTFNFLMRFNKHQTNKNWSIIPWGIDSVDRLRRSEHPCTLTDLAMYGSTNEGKFPPPKFPPERNAELSEAITPLELGELASRFPPFPTLKTGTIGEYDE